MKNENGKKKNSSVKSVPEGFNTVTSYLIVDDASALLEFIKNSFGGQLTYIMKDDESGDRPCQRQDEERRQDYQEQIKALAEQEL